MRDLLIEIIVVLTFIFVCAVIVVVTEFSRGMVGGY